MSTDPWKSADPQPGDFDGDLAEPDPRYVQPPLQEPAAHRRIGRANPHPLPRGDRLRGG
jgi:hypothetical protein